MAFDSLDVGSQTTKNTLGYQCTKFKHTPKFIESNTN